MDRIPGRTQLFTVESADDRRGVAYGSDEPVRVRGIQHSDAGTGQGPARNWRERSAIWAALLRYRRGIVVRRALGREVCFSGTAGRAHAQGRESIRAGV